jgi:hypothetical protein
MRSLLVGLLSLCLIALACGAEPSSSDGGTSSSGGTGGTGGTSKPHCTKGCPCGNACIDCSKKCHK